MKRLASALYAEVYPFRTLFDEIKEVYSPLALRKFKPTAMIVWGGEDISPTIYGHTHYDGRKYMHILSRRDETEVELIRTAIQDEIPLIGICRGAQMLCAIAGGTLIQDVNHHALRGLHGIETDEGKHLLVTSTHHQMMNPGKVDHKLIAWASPKLSNIYIGDGGKLVTKAYAPDFKEPEIVWFPGIKALCIQGHPEYCKFDHEFVTYARDLVSQYVLGKTG